MAVAGNYEGGGDKPEEAGKQVNDQVTWSTTEGGVRVCVTSTLKCEISTIILHVGPDLFVNNKKN